MENGWIKRAGARIFAGLFKMGVRRKGLDTNLHIPGESSEFHVAYYTYNVYLILFKTLIVLNKNKLLYYK